MRWESCSDTNVVARVWNGDGNLGGGWDVAPRSGPTSHWFRYEATANLDTGTWDCSLYDMGLVHPEFNTPKGALVHSWKNLRCRAPADEGLSAICVYGQGMVGFDPWDVYNPGAGLLDNIRVEKVPSGCLVLVR